MLNGFRSLNFQCGLLGYAHSMNGREVSVRLSWDAGLPLQIQCSLI